MKKLPFAVILISLAVARGADERPAKAGFWERTWQSTKHGAGWVWGSTKRAGEKTVDVATSPFRKGEPASSNATSGVSPLAMTISLNPAVVRLPDTRVIEVTVAVVNKGKKAVALEFPTSQRIEVLVKNEAGRVLSRWSDDQRLDKEPGFALVNPKERLEYNARVSTRDMGVGQSFQIEAFLFGSEGIHASRTVTPTR